MSYSKAREETIDRMARHGIGYEDARWFLRQASTLQRISEVQCSFEISERETARLERKEESAEERITKRAQDLGWYVSFQGDPRGCPFMLYKGLAVHSVEISVPGRGLPARCFT